MDQVTEKEFQDEHEGEQINVDQQMMKEASDLEGSTVSFDDINLELPSKVAIEENIHDEGAEFQDVDDEFDPDNPIGTFREAIAYHPESLLSDRYLTLSIYAISSCRLFDSV